MNKFKQPRLYYLGRNTPYRIKPQFLAQNTWFYAQPRAFYAIQNTNQKKPKQFKKVTQNQNQTTFGIDQPQTFQSVDQKIADLNQGYQGGTRFNPKDKDKTRRDIKQILEQHPVDTLNFKQLTDLIKHGFLIQKQSLMEIAQQLVTQCNHLISDKSTPLTVDKLQTVCLAKKRLQIQRKNHQDLNSFLLDLTKIIDQLFLNLFDLIDKQKHSELTVDELCNLLEICSNPLGLAFCRPNGQILMKLERYLQQVDANDLSVQQYNKIFKSYNTRQLHGRRALKDYLQAYSQKTDGYKQLDLAQFQTVLAVQSIIYCDFLENNPLNQQAALARTQDFVDEFNKIIESGNLPDYVLLKKLNMIQRALIECDWYGTQALEIVALYEKILNKFHDDKRYTPVYHVESQSHMLSNNIVLRLFGDYNEDQIEKIDLCSKNILSRLCERVKKKKEFEISRNIALELHQNLIKIMTLLDDMYTDEVHEVCQAIKQYAFEDYRYDIKETIFQKRLHQDLITLYGEDEVLYEPMINGLISADFLLKSRKLIIEAAGVTHYNGNKKLRKKYQVKSMMLGEMGYKQLQIKVSFYDKLEDKKNQIEQRVIQALAMK